MSVEATCPLLPPHQVELTVEAPRRDLRYSKKIPASEKMNKQLIHALRDIQGRHRCGNELVFSEPICACYCCKDKPTKGEFVSAVSQKMGRKTFQEDRFLPKTEITFTIGGREKRALLFGVFDGHSDHGKAGEYLKAHLPTALSRALSEAKILSDEVVGDAFVQVLDALSRGYARTEKGGGTTAALVFICDGRIYCPNVGDSRVMLVKPDATYQLTEDAKLENKRFLEALVRGGCRFLSEERQLFSYTSEAKLPGWVAPPAGELDYRLSLARDIGHEWLCAIPKISRIFHGDAPDDPSKGLIHYDSGDYLILATDGFTDAVTVEDAGKELRKLASCDLSLQSMADTMASEVESQDGFDNVTVMIIRI